MNHLLRPLSESDLPLLLRCMEEFYRLGEMAFSHSDAKEAVRQLLDHPEYGRIWIITLDGEAVGYAVVTFWFSLEFHGRSAFLDELYVREAYRRRKIGTFTIQAVEEFLKQEGIGTLRLEVDKENHPAFELYARNSFRPHDRILMTKWV
jgi:ribosomal protein S18 acetylase RimI-like enzyme